MCKNIPNYKTGVFLKIKIRLSFNVIFRHKLHWLNKFNNTLLCSTYRFSLQCGFSRGKMMHKIGTCQSVRSSRSTFKQYITRNHDNVSNFQTPQRNLVWMKTKLLNTAFLQIIGKFLWKKLWEHYRLYHGF